MSDTIVAEGVWCVECEVFEVEDFLDGHCPACGCPDHCHATAQVVAK